MKNSKGFTLVELLIVVSLIIIVVGVTGDIVVSLVRSYSKTQITNEVEQNANFVMTKLEKELKNATSVTNLTTSSITFNRRLPEGTYEEITYNIKSDGTMSREITDSGFFEVQITNDTAPHGVYVDPLLSSFSNETVVGGPTIVKIVIVMRQLGSPTIQFTQDITLESTVVVRGSY